MEDKVGQFLFIFSVHLSRVKSVEPRQIRFAVFLPSFSLPRPFYKSRRQRSTSLHSRTSTSEQSEVTDHSRLWQSAAAFLSSKLDTPQVNIQQCQHCDHNEALVYLRYSEGQATMSLLKPNKSKFNLIALTVQVPALACSSQLFHATDFMNT